MGKVPRPVAFDDFTYNGLVTEANNTRSRPVRIRRLTATAACKTLIIWAGGAVVGLLL